MIREISELLSGLKAEFHLIQLPMTDAVHLVIAVLSLQNRVVLRKSSHTKFTWMVDSLNKILAKSDKLSNSSIALLLERWHQSKSLNAREILLNFHQQDSYLYFVLKGCFRLFVIDNQDNEVNIGFAFENTFITSFQSFIQEKPSSISIESILDSEIVAIHKKDLKFLIHESAEISQWYQSLLEETLSGHIQRQTELLTLKPHEKYDVFIKRSGHLINAIPLKHIASYLMMAPETLSRVRAKIS